VRLVRAVAAALLLVTLGVAPGSAQSTGRTMAYVGHLATDGPAGAVAVAGTRAYIATRTSATTPVGTVVQILDLTDPARPTRTGRVDLPVNPSTPETVSGIAIDGARLYLATCGSPYDLGNLRVFDVTDVSRPVQLGSVATTYNCATAVAATGRYAYVSSGIPYMSGPHATLDVFDLADPTTPTRVGSLGLIASEGISDIALAGSRAYLADNSYGLRVVDVTDPTKPATLAVDRGGRAVSVEVQGTYAYVGGAGLRVVDVSNPTAPRAVATLAAGSSVASLALAGSSLYAAAGLDGLWAFDTSDPTRPSLAAAYALASPAGIAAASGLAFVSDPAGALWVLRGPVASVAAAELLPRSYLGLVLKNGTWSAAPGATFASSISVQNRGLAMARVALSFRRPDGTAALAPLELQVGPGRNQLVYLPSIADLPSGQYGVVVASDQPVLVQANLLGSGPQAAAYDGRTAAEASSVLWAPGVFRAYFGYSSTITLQNPHGTATRTTIAYRDAEGNVVGTEVRTVPAFGTVDVPQASAPVPDGFVGGATIAGDAPLLALLHAVGASGELGGAVAIGSVTAQSTGDLSIPSLYKNYSADGWISSLILQNRDVTAADVTLTFQQVASTEPIVVKTRVPAYGVRQLYLGNVPELPEGFAGAVSIRSSGGRVLATANTRNARGNFATCAAQLESLFTTSGVDTNVYLPALYNAYSSLGWTSSFVVQNTSASPVTVEITYYDADGPVKTITEGLLAGESRLHYQPDPREGLPEGFHGSAVIRASFGTRVAVVANVLAAGQNGGDWLLSYEGLTAGPYG
jgi:hypothetical protein